MTAAEPTKPAQGKPTHGRFVTGPLRQHILSMTAAGAVGLVAIFIGDLANILFLSRLDDVALIAAVGYASSLLFIMISISIGLSIGASAAIAPELGRGDRDEARRLAVHAIVLAVLVSCAVAICAYPFVPPLLRVLGADGRALDLASDYTRILLASMPMLALAIMTGAILRSVGDAQRAMYVTLSVAFVNVLLDPILILYLEYGIYGAAIATSISRSVGMGVGLYGAIAIHDLIGRPQAEQFPRDALRLGRVGLPAVATNLATPFANAYVTAAIAAYGDAAVAGWAFVGRLLPVAFGAIYALTGAVGPIIGQNYGVADRGRMREAVIEALKVTAAFTLAAWAILAVFSMPIVMLFRADGDTAALIYAFCLWIAPLFVFLGAMFISNACFNALGRPQVSTAFNWTRATFGTIPFVMAFGAWFGAEGVLAGQFIGGVPVGILAVWFALRTVDSLDLKAGGRV
ncbi:MAG: MATE family efflux transporter [Pseudomonadota bacterium]